MKTIYFKGLTEIRAIAALFVLLHHIELYKARDSVSSLYHTVAKPLVSKLGENGVFIFFCLSGFLITSLLLAEKINFGRINVKKFYFRRILRIWPLYYLIILISFVIIPLLANNISAFQNEESYYTRVLLLYESPYLPLILLIFMLPNLALYMKPAVVGASQSWSVGAEEQFYLIWPHLFNITKKKSTLLIIFCCVACLPYFGELIYLFNPRIGGRFISLLSIAPFHFMAYGAIGAHLYFYKNKILLTLLSNRYLFIINSVLLVALLYFPFDKPLFGIIVTIEILFIVQPHFKWNLRSVVLQKLGRISYGIYMYHPFVMYLCFSIFNSILPIENLVLYNIAIYFSITGITLLLSYLSYHYFEQYFLNIKKKKFTIIKSKVVS